MKKKKWKRYLAIELVAIMLLCKVYVYHNEYFKAEMLEDNKDKYSKEIDEYNEAIEEYAKTINSLNLNHLEIIMKVISDQWDSYYYRVDEDLISGYYRLSFQEKGYGVCTSFADDFTAKMNAINPAYEAKNVTCYMSDEIDAKELKLVDIDRKVVSIRDFDDDEVVSFFVKLFETGNHMVSMISIPNEDYKLIVDPTNLMIGLIKNGKMYIFNSSNPNIMEYVRNGNIIVLSEDYVSEKDTYYQCEESYNELCNIYGYEEQREALDYVEELEKNNGYTRTLKKEAN